MALRRSSIKERAPESTGTPPEDGPRRTLSAGAPLLPSPTEKLGEILIRKDRLTATQLNEALLQQSASGKRIGVLLVELGALDEGDLAWALAEQFQIELVDLGRETPDPEAVALLTASMARAEDAIPVRFGGTSVIIAGAGVPPEIPDRLQL